MHLSLAEHGAYTLLLDAYYASAGKLPRHLSELNRVCGAVSKIERDAVMNVAQQFFPTDDAGDRHNKRADMELNKAASAIEKMIASGKKGASKRWGTP
jgi:uncharacterized protein YdaU (DUF1376 family)